jgi:hypothetical protein
MENIQYYKTFPFDQASDHDTVTHTCDNILAHSAIVDSSRLCDAASNRANNLFSNSAQETKRHNQILTVQKSWKKENWPLQYSWRFATATSKPRLALAEPTADGTPCLPASSSANDPMYQNIKLFNKYDVQKLATDKS